MAHSQVEIANVALVGLRAGIINSFDDESTEARSVKTLWDTVRRAELAKHPWNFAIKRVELPRLVATPVFGYNYQYQLPSDHIRTLRVEGSTDFREEQKRILSNDEDVYIKYVFDNSDVTSWTPHFDNLVSARLRLELAYTLAGDKNMIQLSQDLYERMSREARWIDASADPSDRFSQEPTNVLNARFASTGYKGVS